jgi:hypothetical protein
MNTELTFVKDWPEQLLVAYSPTLIARPDKWYGSISDKFWKWARTLPNFDPIALYNIVLLPEILK